MELKSLFVPHSLSVLRVPFLKLNNFILLKKSNCRAEKSKTES